MLRCLGASVCCFLRGSIGVMCTFLAEPTKLGNGTKPLSICGTAAHTYMCMHTEHTYRKSERIPTQRPTARCTTVVQVAGVGCDSRERGTDGQGGWAKRGVRGGHCRRTPTPAECRKPNPGDHQRCCRYRLLCSRSSVSCFR